MEGKLDEIAGMDAELMPCWTQRKVNNCHVRSNLTGDPNMKGWRFERRVGGAWWPLEMSFKTRTQKKKQKDHCPC